VSGPTRVGRVADIRLGRQRSPENHHGDHMVPYLRSANIIDGSLVLDDVKSMNFDPAEQRVFALRDGDILVTEGSGSRDTVGAAAMWDDSLPSPVCFQNTLLRLRPGPTLDRRYLYWWTQHGHRSGLFAEAAGGQSILHLGAETLAALPILVPAIEVQSQVADFLDDQIGLIDQVVVARQQQIGHVDEDFSAVGDRIVCGADSTQELVCAEWKPFGMVPSAWGQGRLRSVPGEVRTGPFGSQLHSDEYLDDGWPVVNPASLKGSRIVPVDGMAVSGEVRNRLSRHVLHVNDVVFGRRGELGRAALVTAAEQGWLLGTGSLVVRLKPDADLVAEYLMRLLETAPLRYYFDSQAVGSTMANLNTSILMGMPLLLPPMSEQEAIVRRFSREQDRHDSLRASLVASVTLLSELKRSLISAAVSGEFDVSSASGRGVPE
jgi:type I restriction enzyme, S subunit